MRFLTKNPYQVRFEASIAPADAARTEGIPFISIPMGMKYMFATECSNPDATKAVMGKNIAKILPATSRDAIAIQTARQTSQLQPTPLANASRKLRLTFALAMLMAYTPTPRLFIFQRPDQYISMTRMSEPARLAR